MSKIGSHLDGTANAVGRLFNLLAEIVQNALKILSLELREEKIHFIQIFIMATITVFLAVLSMVVITFTAIYAIPVEYRLLGLLIASGVFLIATLVLALVLVYKLSRHPIPFTHAISEMTRSEE
jgi:uncharacterized membrane protein YqjE